MAWIAHVYLYDDGVDVSLSEIFGSRKPKCPERLPTIADAMNWVVANTPAGDDRIVEHIYLNDKRAGGVSAMNDQWHQARKRRAS